MMWPVRKTSLFVKIAAILIPSACVLDLVFALTFGASALLPTPFTLAIAFVASWLKHLPLGVTITLMFSSTILLICLPFHLARLMLSRADRRDAAFVPEEGVELGEVGNDATRHQGKWGRLSFISRLMTVRLIRSVR